MHKDTSVCIVMLLAFILGFWVASLFMPTPAYPAGSGRESFTVEKGHDIYTITTYRGMLRKVEHQFRYGGAIFLILFTPNHTVLKKNGEEVERWNKVEPLYEDEFPQEWIE